MAPTWEFKANGKAIAIGFTEQQLSPHAGSATFWAWLRPRDWCQTLTAALPHPLPLSNNHLLPLEKALAFRHGLLCDARKLTHIASLRRDPLAPELLGIRRWGKASRRARASLARGARTSRAMIGISVAEWRAFLRCPSGAGGD